MYSSPVVQAAISRHFVPVRVHVKDKEAFAALGARFDAQWTPATLIIDRGIERHRVEGFLPLGDFLPQLLLGRAHAARHAGDFAEAERRFRTVIEEHPQSEAAAEAQYWAGVSRYKATNDFSALVDTARAFDARYGDSSWARKASVWKHKEAS